MLVNQAREIKANLELCSLREIKKYIGDLRHSLTNYKYKNEINEVTEYQIYKLCCKIDDIDIFDLRYKEIEKYINDLISILGFIGV